MTNPDKLVGDAEIEQTLQELLADWVTVFESMLVLLPTSQAQVLESLALDPTDKPSNCIIRKITSEEMSLTSL